MTKRTYRLISFLLLTLFVSYRVSIFAFTHVHVVNGAIIAHSHPYSNKSHSHSTNEFITIALLSAIQSLESEPCELSSVDYPIIYQLSVPTNTFHQLLKHEQGIPARAPPFYC